MDNRVHGCMEEQLILTCNASGRIIIWEIVSDHGDPPEEVNIEFDNTTTFDMVKRWGVQTISAFLLHRMPDRNGEVSKTNFVSIIFIDIETVKNILLPGTISCSSGTANAIFNGSIARKYKYIN